MFNSLLFVTLTAFYTIFVYTIFYTILAWIYIKLHGFLYRSQNCGDREKQLQILAV